MKQETMTITKLTQVEMVNELHEWNERFNHSAEDPKFSLDEYLARTNRLVEFLKYCTAEEKEYIYIDGMGTIFPIELGDMVWEYKR